MQGHTASPFTSSVQLMAVLTIALLPGCGFNIGFENDVGGFGGGSDRNYTNGFRLQQNYVVPETGRARLMGSEDAAQDGEAAGSTDDASTEGWRKGTAAGADPWLDLIRLEESDNHTITDPIVGLALGQAMYTPNKLDVGKDGKRDGIIGNDRPYAGWLYVAVVRYLSRLDDDEERRRDTQLSAEFDLGVTGKPSLAKQTQKLVHKQIDSTDPQGWHNQLDFEPGVILRMARRDRWYFTGDPDHYGADVITHLGGAVGNISTMGEVAALVRWGKHMPRDWGPSPVETGILGTAGTDELSWYVFGGAAGRFVVRDIFLDGNSFSRDGHSVPKEHVVGESRAGVALAYQRMTVVFTRIKRSREFTRQDGPHSFGSLILSFGSRF